jgi:hypothetical protein
MSARERAFDEIAAGAAGDLDAGCIGAVVEERSTPAPHAPSGLCIGRLIGITDNGTTALVTHANQRGSAALRARTVVDVHAAHVGRRVVLMLEEGDPAKPIVMGVVRDAEGWPLPDRPGQLQVDADGERLILSARNELVLRCGKASITLTKAGKVLVQGTHVLSRSSGPTQIRGASVQLN